MNREDARQEARKRLRDFADSYLQKSKSGLYCCPICGSGHGAKGTGALGIFADGTRWKCQACGACGDIFDLYAKLNDTQGADTFRGVFSLYGIEQDQRGSVPAAREIFAEQPEDFAEYYKKKAAALSLLTDYHKRRGISDETATRFMLGYDPAWKHPKAPADAPETPRLIIPVSRNTYVARRTDGGEDYAKQKAGAGSWTFNAQALQTAQKPVFIVEGEIDAISVCEAGGEAVALGSTAYTNMFTQLLDAQKPVQPLVLAMDNDPAGQQAADKLEAELRSRGISFYRCNDLYGAEKDANAALCADRAAFTAAIRAAEQAAGTPEELRVIDTFLQKAQSKAYEPIPTGIRDIDRALSGGLFRQALVLLGAAPAMGKTALAQWIFEHMAAAGQSVLYVNLEMSREQLLARSLSRRIRKATGRDLSALDVLQGYKWTDEQREAVTSAAALYRDEIAGNLIYNPDGTSADLDSILQGMEQAAIRQQDAGKRAPIVCIDYLQLVRGKDREDDPAIIKRAVKAFKDYAVKYDTVVFVIMAQNRASNESGRSEVTSGRDTSAIEYSGDIIAGLNYTALEDGRTYATGTDKSGNEKRVKYDLEKIRDIKKRAYEKCEYTPAICNEISLKILKNRFGTDGRRADLIFDGKHSSFDQAAIREAFGEWQDAGQQDDNPFLQEETAGDKLRAIRGGRTRKDVEGGTGIKPAALAKMEAGKLEATEEEKEKLSAFYGVHAADIWG